MAPRRSGLISLCYENVINESRFIFHFAFITWTVQRIPCFYAPRLNKAANDVHINEHARNNDSLPDELTTLAYVI